MTDEELLAFLSMSFRAKALIDAPRHAGVDMSVPLEQWRAEFNATVENNGGMQRVTELLHNSDIRII